MAREKYFYSVSTHLGQARRNAAKSLFLQCASVAQLDRATGFEPVGWVFESPRARFSARLMLSWRIEESRV